MATLETLSDHVYDICENAVRSKSSVCELTIFEDDENFRFIINDHGCGMNQEELMHAISPFYTTKEQRKKKLGVGLPFLKFSSELTGGYFKIESEKLIGTKVDVLFKKSNIDCQPVGNIPETLFMIIYMDKNTDWKVIRGFREDAYELDSKDLKEQYGNLFYENSFMIEIKKIITELENQIKQGGLE